MELSELQVKWESLKVQKEEISKRFALVSKEILKLEAKNQDCAKASSKNFPIVRDFNFIIGDIDPDGYMDSLNLMDRVFGKDAEIHNCHTFWDCLVKANVFESKSQARKNWKGSELEFGFQEIGPIGKSKTHLFIWNLEKK